MIHRKYLFLCLMTFSLSGVVLAEQVNIKPGLWETNYSMKVEGVPPQMAAMMQQSQPPKETECVKDNKVDFMPGDMGENCQYKKQRHSASKMTFSFSCDDHGVKSQGKGEINYKSTSVSGFFDVHTTGMQGAPMHIHNSFKGKRIGSCR